LPGLLAMRAINEHGQKEKAALDAASAA
jgi:hypothetical protein